MPLVIIVKKILGDEKIINFNKTVIFAPALVIINITIIIVYHILIV